MKIKTEIEFSASLMCVDFLHLADQMNELTQAGIHRWHYDVMDGHFVPNITMGCDILRTINQVTRLPIDVHLMVAQPELFIPSFVEAGASRIYFHIESTRAPHRLANLLSNLGVEAGVAINAATPLETLTTVLPMVTGMLFMCVDPGFSGQPLVPNMESRIQTFVDRYDADDVSIAVDGHIDPRTAKRMVEVGVDHLILGTSTLFRENITFSTALGTLRAVLREGTIN